MHLYCVTPAGLALVFVHIPMALGRFALGSHTVTCRLERGCKSKKHNGKINDTPTDFSIVFTGTQFVQLTWLELFCFWDEMPTTDLTNKVIRYSRAKANGLTIRL